ncbi:MAG: S41 family peptidase [Bacteroidales bacterium]
MKKNIFGIIVAITIAVVLFSSCKKDKEENPNLDVNTEFLNTMEYWYLWYDKLPDVDPGAYSSPAQLLEALRYSELDRWSYITTKQEMEAYYEAGEYIGFGMGTAFDEEDNLWITFVFDDSPLKEFGADRGWQITKIDDTTPTPENISDLLGSSSEGVTKSFTAKNNEGNSVDFTATKRVVTMNTVLLDTTYNGNNSNIGYLVLKGFITPTNNELDEAFSKFLLEGVNELIVDLRYNGGGSVDAANYMANLIAGQTADNEILGEYVHNDKRSENDVAIYIENETNSLIINRVVFITTRNSASASELVINGLKPHIPITLVGENTYGKPVGMYGLGSNLTDYAYVPVCFKILNADGYGDYYEGIPADIEQIDGINYPFGDLNEPSLNSAITFIDSGEKIKATHKAGAITYPNFTGLQGEIGAW